MIPAFPKIFAIGTSYIRDIFNEPVEITEKIVDSIEEIKSLLDRESYLGGAKIEGIVVKNHHRKWILGDRPMPLMAGKLVSESFKEVNRHVWDEAKPKNRLERFMDSFRTEARWRKSIQHAEENGALIYDPKDIGMLIRAIHEDIEIEEEQEIKNFLWREFKGDIFRKSTAGFPEWYKAQLAERNFHP